MKLKFSIITPLYIYNKKRFYDFLRCSKSVDAQTNRNFEHIVVDQSEDYYQLHLLKNTHLIKQPHIERIFALREGFVSAEGEWICLLDSDDIYLPHYLETVEQMIANYPKVKLFNFGSIHIHKDGRAIVRDEFTPKKKKRGHESFNGGSIVNGTFVFHRSVWEDLGDFPETTERLWNPWDFSIAAQEEFPEIQKYFVVDHPDHPEGMPKELGNPWGNDYYLFYKYTRKYHSVPINKHLYVVYHK